MDIEDIKRRAGIVETEGPEAIIAKFEMRLDALINDMSKEVAGSPNKDQLAHAVRKILSGHSLDFYI